ncbi:drug/metabolite transporter (DMT)-like permease [Marmoricola sp. OAE513]|uniref:DMT family transporter n=1 Tax=Marmoricola sp. OAE513 TaxID=2817894 RepID=UPI001AEA3CE0
MTVALALVAAVLYGLSDFIGGVASRRTSVWPIGFLACVGGTAGAVVIALFDPGDPTRPDVLWGLLAGLGSGTGTAFLYRGLASGRMGVVAPVSGLGAVLIPLAVGVLGGERPGWIGWIGIVLALPGIWFVSREETAAADEGARSGLLDGVLAGVGFGLLFAALGQVGDDAGYWPLAGAQAMSIASLVVAALLLGGNPVPRARADLWGLLPGLLATCAVLFFILATNEGLLSIAAVITSLYPAFTVLLAIAVLRERVHRTQAFGLLLCTASVVFVSLP